MIVAGFGFSTKATTHSLRAALDAARGGREVDALAALDEMRGLVDALAAETGLPVFAVAAKAASKVETPTRSERSISARGMGSVAEAVALAVAGPGARLLAPRAISGDGLATCALAEGAPR